MQITINKLIKSKRKTFSIEINKQAQLIVRAPGQATQSDIDFVISKKRQWIIRKMNEMKAINAELAKSRISYAQGDLIPLLGKKYSLCFADDIQRNWTLSGDSLYIRKERLDDAPEIITAMYKQQAKKLIPERVHHFAGLLGIKFRNIRINSARTRWGSCSSKGNINFSWRLMLAPPEVVDYVVIHELVHLIELNHSKRYWHIVSQVFPDYMICEKWLKHNARLLDLFD